MPSITHARVTQAYGLSHNSYYIVVPCCTAAQTGPVPNVALRSPHKMAIECFMGCLGKLSASRRCQLVLNLALLGTFPPLMSKGKSDGSVAG